MLTDIPISLPVLHTKYHYKNCAALCFFPLQKNTLGITPYQYVHSLPIFFFMAAKTIICMYHSLFNQPPTDRHLCYFFSFAIINNVVMKILNACHYILSVYLWNRFLDWDKGYLHI